MSAILYVRAQESTELVHARHSDPERTNYLCGGCDRPVCRIPSFTQQDGLLVREHYRHQLERHDAFCNGEKVLEKYAAFLLMRDRPRIKAFMTCGHGMSWDWPKQCRLVMGASIPDSSVRFTIGVYVRDVLVTGLFVRNIHELDRKLAEHLRESRLDWLEVNASDVVAGDPRAVRAVRWDGCDVCRYRTEEDRLKMGQENIAKIELQCGYTQLAPDGRTLSSIYHDEDYEYLVYLSGFGPKDEAFGSVTRGVKAGAKQLLKDHEICIQCHHKNTGNWEKAHMSKCLSCFRVKRPRYDE